MEEKQPDVLSGVFAEQRFPPGDQPDYFTAVTKLQPWLAVCMEWLWLPQTYVTRFTKSYLIRRLRIVLVTLDSPAYQCNRANVTLIAVSALDRTSIFCKMGQTLRQHSPSFSSHKDLLLSVICLNENDSLFFPSESVEVCWKGGSVSLCNGLTFVVMYLVDTVWRSSLNSNDGF